MKLREAQNAGLVPIRRNRREIAQNAAKARWHGGKPSLCSACGRDGHNKRTCPEMRAPILRALGVGS